MPDYYIIMEWIELQFIMYEYTLQSLFYSVEYLIDIHTFIRKIYNTYLTLEIKSLIPSLQFSFLIYSFRDLETMLALPKSVSNYFMMVLHVLLWIWPKMNVIKSCSSNLCETQVKWINSTLGEYLTLNWYQNLECRYLHYLDIVKSMKLFQISNEDHDLENPRKTKWLKLEWYYCCSKT